MTLDRMTTGTGLALAASLLLTPALRAHGLFADDEDTERLRDLDGVITPFDDAWTFPVTAEVEILLD